MDLRKAMLPSEVETEFGIPARTVAGWCQNSANGTLQKHPLPEWGYRKAGKYSTSWLLHYDAVAAKTGKNPRAVMKDVPEGMSDCPECFGSGITFVDSGAFSKTADPRRCSSCDGKGIVTAEKASEWLGEEFNL